jgi:hypothetical protein
VATITHFHQKWRSLYLPAERITISFEGNEGKTPPPDDGNGNAPKEKPTKPKDPAPPTALVPFPTAPGPTPEEAKPTGGENAVVSQPAPVQPSVAGHALRSRGSRVFNER